jgi:hypothetical protein
MKWRSILITTLVVIVLGIILYWLNTKSRESTFTAANTAFAVEDTAAIDEIHLSNLQGQEVILKQQPDHQWRVNDKFQASQTKVETLLHTIYHVEVKKPVPLESRENVIKSLATQNVQVDIYQDDNLVRSYYVGHQTPSELGTYMAMNNEDKKPYVTHIPGFYGYLSSRFFCDPDEWRSTLIWNFNPVAIQEVKVDYPNGDKEPFHLQKEGENAFTIKHLNKNSKLKNYDLKQVKRYLMNFRDFHCVRDMKDIAKRDSLMQYTPDARLTVKDDTDNKRSLAVYNAFGKANDTVTTPGKPNNYFATTPMREDQVLLIQNLQIDPMLKGFSHFESPKNN